MKAGRAILQISYGKPEEVSRRWKRSIIGLEKRKSLTINFVYTAVYFLVFRIFLESALLFNTNQKYPFEARATYSVMKWAFFYILFNDFPY